MEKIAFIVVAWNNETIIAQCLESILAQEGAESSIYVLDNASDDQTVDIVRHYPQVRLFRSRVNSGFARGNNILIREALKDPDVKWFALVNSDVTLDPLWAKTLAEFGSERAKICGLQGLTLDYYDHSTVDSQHIFVSGRLQGIQYGYGKEKELSTYYPRKVFGVNAAAALFSRDFVINQPDSDSLFFDERFFMYYEDVDLAFRGLVSGYNSYFVPTAIAYHMGSFSTAKRPKDYAVTLMARNQIAMVFKNIPTSVFVDSLPSFIGGIVSFIRQVRKDLGKETARAVFWSYMAGLIRIPLFIKSRLAIRSKSTIDPRYLMSVIHHDGILG